MSLHRPQKHSEKITAPVPLVSFIVPTMNRLGHLPVALDSLRRQTFKDFEVVIVNDAGEDPLPVIEPFAECLDILYLSHETSRGASAARNTGLRAARGRLIAYLDDDDFYYEDHLEMLVQAIRESGASVVYSDANCAKQYLDEGRLVLHSRRVHFSEDFDPQKLLGKNVIPILCVMHEKHCLNEAGYFREDLQLLVDLDLWIRMSRFYSFLHLPYTTCEYSARGGTLSQNVAAMTVTHAYLGRRASAP